MKNGAIFAVSCAGGYFDSRRTSKSSRGLDLKWNGAWSRAVKREENEWRAEIGIPLSTLAGIDVDINALQINALAKNLSGQGRTLVYLADPMQTRFDRCQGSKIEFGRPRLSRLCA